MKFLIASALLAISTTAHYCKEN